MVKLVIVFFLFEVGFRRVHSSLGASVNTMGLLLVICVATVLTGIAGSTSNTVPEWKKWCGRRHDCPKYKVLKVYDEFEIRKYPLYKWATTNEKKLPMILADGFNALKILKYIHHGNAKKVSIPMTVPIVNRIMEEDQATFKKDFTMMYWLPEKFQADPPAPIDGNAIQIVEWEERIVYVASYGGWGTENHVRYGANRLREALEKADMEYDNSYIYASSYQSPFHIGRRHNEVMFSKQ